MSEENAMDQTLQMYANPAMIQTTALDKLSAQVLGGEPVVDGNNVFTFLNEFNAQCTAGFATAVSKKFEALYPSRAQTFNDLYGHMSDWDFEGLYAYPSTTKIQVAFDRKFLIDNAVRVDQTDYFKIVLPEFSTFTIGEYKFGIHYPIEIQIRKAYVTVNGQRTEEIDYDACNITTQWDLSVSNPLCNYDTNILEHRNYVSGGMTFLCIEVPVYQFVRTTHFDDAISNTGYLNKFDYDDKFYVLRVYHKQEGVWEELAQSYSSIVYDPQNATALVKVYPDLNQVTVEIPQIYFDNELVGSQLRVDIYTTKGAMNVDISSYTKDQFSGSFLTNDDRTADTTYSDKLKYVNTCIVAPLYTKITDGNNGIDLAELKRRVVDRTEKNLLITADKITSYLKGRGFTAKNYVDNITGRYYLAEKVLTDDSGTIISAGSFNTVFRHADINPTWNDDLKTYYFANHNTFVFIDANSFMILPNTVYKYNEDEDTCSPMDNNFMKKVEELNTDEKIKLLNSSIYSFSPFHLKVTTKNSIPVAAYYDLLSPKVMNVNFPVDGENIHTNTQISMYNHSIQHLNDGTGGYVFDILLYKTDDLKDIPVVGNEGLVENIKVLLRFKNEEGVYSYMYGTYAGEADKHDWIRFNLTTNYVIDSNEKLGFTCFIQDNDSVGVDLTQEFEILFFVSKEVFSGEETQTYPPDIPAVLKANYVWLATQNVTLCFGNSVDQLLTNVYIESEEKSLQTYPTTVFATYTDNVYYRWTQEDVDSGAVDWKGNKVTQDMIGIYKYDPTITGNENGLIILHNKSDVIISSDTAEVVPLSFMLRRTIITTKEEKDVEYLYVLSNKYTQTSKEDNEFVLVEHRVPEKSDKGGYYIDTVNEEGTESKRHEITQAIIDAKQLLYIESSIDINTDTPTETECRSTRVIIDALRLMWDIGHENVVNQPRDLRTIILQWKGYCDEADLPTEGMIDGDTYTITDKGNEQYAYISYAENSEVAIKDTKWVKLPPKYKMIVPEDPTKTTYKLYDPQRYKHFLFSASVDSADYTEPEYIPTDVSFEAKMTLYRVDPSLDMVEYISFTYKDFITGYETAFDLASIKILWDDIDTLPTETAVIEKWGITATTLEYMKRLRFPFIKVMNFDTANKLKTYLDTESHTKHGFVEVFKQKPTSIEDLSVNYQYYRYLSFKDNGSLQLDHTLCQWDQIDKWPWELNNGCLVDWKTANYTENFELFLNESTSVVIAHEQGSVVSEEGVVSDTYEVPIEDGDADTRKLAYNIRMLHLDYKLLYSDETAHQTYRTSTVEKIRSFFTTIDETRLRLLEGTNLYYSPVRTMGYAKFKGKSGEYFFMDLNFTIGFRIHAETFISSSPSSKTTIKTNTLSIVDTRIATGTVSLVDMASDIQGTMNDMIVYVDVLGVNGNQSIQTLFRTDTSTIPHLGYRLIKNDNGSIGVERSLDLEYSVIR